MSDTSARSIEALTGSFIGIAVVIVGLRFFARSRLKIPYLIDDWLMLLALMSFLGFSTCVLLLVHIKAIGYSSFQFTTDEKIARYAKSTKIQTSLVVTTVACLACTKASALFFYRRIFVVRGRSHPIFSTLITASIIIVACWSVAFTFLAIFQCQGHFSGLWDPKLYARYCTVSWNFLYGFSVSDVLLDVLILVLPIPKILYLHTTIAKKLSVLGVFMLGCAALGASVARLAIYIQIYMLGVTKLDKVDSEHILTRYVFCYVLECGCSILAINLPSVWSIFNGTGLEHIMKMARSVTSLTSWSSSRSRSKSVSADRHELTDVENIHCGDKSDSFVGTRGPSSRTESTQPRLEIIRQDSVYISSEVRRPQSAYRREESWS